MIWIALIFFLAAGIGMSDSSEGAWKLLAVGILFALPFLIRLCFDLWGICDDKQKENHKKVITALTKQQKEYDSIKSDYDSNMTNKYNEYLTYCTLCDEMILYNERQREMRNSPMQEWQIQAINLIKKYEQEGENI